MGRWRTKFGQVVAVLCTAVLVGSLTTGPASAAAVVGSTFVPTGNCGAPVTYVQTTSPIGTSYAVASGGVITSWRFQAAASMAPQLKFKVFRPASGTTFTVVGESGLVVPPLSTLSSYPTRIRVAAGDIIGLALLEGGLCAKAGALHYFEGDAAVGSTLPYALGNGTVDVDAIVEPDQDGDGYGDETQDQCSSQATTAGACDLVAPDTRFTAGPTRTKKRKATYAFTSTEPGARFACRLTGKNVKTIQLKTFQPCTSPKKYSKLKPGRYKVFVRAIDVVGNVDLTPDKVKLVVQA